MQSLYERIGGESTIDKLVVTFYQHVLSDPKLQTFFERTSIDKLYRMQKAFFTVALGGPEPEMKMSLYESHKGRGINRVHLTRFTEHLVSTLGEIGVLEDDAKEVYQRIATYSDEILGDSTVDG